MAPPNNGPEPVAIPIAAIPPPVEDSTQPGDVEQPCPTRRAAPGPGARAVGVMAIVTIVAFGLALKGRFDAARAERELRETREAARRTVDRYVETIENEELLKEERFKPLHKKLIEEAREAAETLKPPSGDFEGASRLAETLHDLAWVESAFGSPDRAVAFAERAIAINRRLVKVAPAGDADRRRALTDALRTVGGFLNDSCRPDESLAKLREAVEIDDELFDRDPTNRAIQTRLAEDHLELADAHEALGDLSAAIVAHERALELLESIPTAARSDESDEVLSRCECNLGTLLCEVGRMDEGLAKVRHSLEIDERLLAAQPGDRHRRHSLYVAWAKLGWVQSRREESEEALAATRLALNAVRRLAEDYPVVRDYRLDVARSYLNLASQERRVLWNNARWGYVLRAQAVLEEFTIEEPDLIEAQVLLAETHDELGDWAQELRRAETASTHLLCALSIRESLAADCPQMIDHQAALGESHVSLGKLEMDAGRFESAFRHFESARSILQSVAAWEPANAKRQRSLAWIHFLLGVSCIERQSCNAAIAWLERAGAVFDRHADMGPPPAIIRMLAAQNRHAWGRALVELNDLRAAKDQFRAAIGYMRQYLEQEGTVELYGHSIAGYFTSLAAVHRDLGEAEQAIDVALEASVVAFDVPTSLGAARDLALGMVMLDAEDQEARAQLADRAIELLEQAVGDSQEGREFLQRDPSFDALRRHPRFPRPVAGTPLF